MKTSVIEVRDMLSALSTQAVEKRIGKVPGVESVTVVTMRKAPQYVTTIPSRFMELTIFWKVCHD